MFGKLKVKTEAPVAVPTVREIIRSSVPQPRGISLEELPSKTYLQACKDIGASQLADQDNLKMILAVEVGHEYDLEQVNRFLFKLCPDSQQVVWRGLCGLVDGVDGRLTYDGLTRAICIVGHPRYSKYVPESALNLISVIEKEVPNTFGYFVSDYEAARPDPFLLVRNPLTRNSIVALHWDEPNWRG